MADPRLADFSRRMDGALEALRKEFAGLRTGRASANLLIVIGAVVAVLIVNLLGSAEWVPQQALAKLAIPIFFGAAMYREFYRSCAFGRGDMHLSQVGTVSVPEARLITVQVWDKGLVKAVDKAIREAGLGLNPQVDGATIRVPIPQLTEERRNELAKVAGKYAEQARIAVRNVRRDAMEMLKRLEKDGEISQDEHNKGSAEVQGLTDQHIKKVDEALAAKEKEIKQI